MTRSADLQWPVGTPTWDRHVTSSIRTLIFVTACVFASFCTTPISAQHDTAAKTAEGGAALTADTASPSETLTDTESPINGFARGLPKVAADGRELKQTAFFASQISQLVPDGFQAIAVDTLWDAVKRLESMRDSVKRGKILSSEYRAVLREGSLIGQSAEFVLDKQQTDAELFELGRLNLAVQASEATGIVPGEKATLLNGTDGTLYAMSSEPAVRFRWTRGGRNLDRNRYFDLTIPPTPITKIVIDVDEELVVQSADCPVRSVPIESLRKASISVGVIAPRPLDPIDEESETESPKRRFELEAGGLARIRISIRPRKESTKAVVLRRLSLDYVVRPRGLDWSQQMTVQVPDLGAVPDLLVGGGKVSSVTINGSVASFTSFAVDDTTRRLRVAIPPELRRDSAETIALKISGTASYEARGTDLRLPWCKLEQSNVIGALTEVSASCTFADLLRVRRWILPPDWHQMQPTITTRGETILTATGPLSGVFLFGLQDGSAPKAKTAPSSDADSVAAEATGWWSLLQLATRREQADCLTTSRIELKSDRLTNHCLTLVTVDPNQINPIRFSVQDGWTITSVRFPASGRTIETPTLLPALRSAQPATLFQPAAYQSAGRRDLVIWPSPGDLSGNQLRLVVTGDSRLARVNRTGKEIQIPATWFIRCRGANSTMTAVVVRPEQRNWGGGTALKESQIEFSELSIADRTFLDVDETRAIAFRPWNLQTPELLLSLPDQAFDAKLSSRVHVAGTDLVESVTLEFPMTLPPMNSVQIDSGGASSRGEFKWTIFETGGGTPIVLPDSRYSVSSEQGRDTYSIDLQGQPLQSRQLVGQRRTALKRLVQRVANRTDETGRDLIQFVLPKIEAATSHEAEVLIGDGLRVAEIPRGVLKVPFDTSRTQPHVRLRYSSAEQPTIILASAAKSEAVAMVWKQELRLVASSSGADVIEGRYRIDCDGLIQINFPIDLRLSSVYRNGKRITATDQQRSILQIDGAGTRDLVVEWTRDAPGFQSYRRCSVPEISIEGVVFDSSYTFMTSSDSFAPLSLFSGFSDSASLRVTSTQRLTLVRRNSVIAFGILVSIIWFAFNWMLARRSLLVGLSISLLLACVTALWISWATAIVAWLLLPVVTACLLVVSTRSQTENSVDDDGFNDASNTRGAANPVPSESAERSGSYSFHWPTTILILGAGLGLTGTSGNAQESQAPISESRPIEVLIPIDADGEAVGNKVYMSNQDRDSLISSTMQTAAVETRIESAEYRVELRESLPTTAIVVVDYTISTAEPTGILRIPIPASEILRADLISSDDQRVVRYAADPDAPLTSLISVRPANAFKLRLKLAGTTIRQQGRRILSLTIPPVSQSSLLVQTDDLFDHVRVKGARGRTTRSEVLRRVEAELGGAESIEVSYTFLSGEPFVEAPLRPVYWVHVGLYDIVTECEVRPIVGDVGDEVQLVVLATSIPVEACSGWEILRSESLSPDRWLVTFRQTEVAPAALRVVWKSPQSTAVAASGSPASSRFVIPKVIAPAYGTTAQAWVAVNADSRLRVALEDDVQTEPIAPEQILERWSGPQGKSADRAFVSVSRTPDLMVSPVLKARASTRERQTLHLDGDSSYLRYSSSLSLGFDPLSTLAIRYPHDLELLSLRIDDQVIDTRPVRNGELMEASLRYYGSASTVQIEAIFEATIPVRRSFALPVVGLTPSPITQTVYHVTRGSGAAVRVDEGGDKTLTPAFGLTATSDNAVSIASWQQDSGADVLESVRLRVLPRKTNFSSTQLTSLSWKSGRWSFATKIKLADGVHPDFIDILLPARWCDQLAVDQATTWTRQPSVDPANQIVRIQLSHQDSTDLTIGITGKLLSSDQSRLTVPEVAVLGSGARIRFVSVPNKLANDPIRWRTTGLTPQPTAAEIDPWLESGDVSIYRAESIKWSAELEPTDDVESGTTVQIADYQVFAGEERVLVLCRWDVLPGQSDTVTISLPPSSSLLGIWNSQRPVSLTEIGLGKALENSRVKFRIPLSLTRLAQSVEMLFEVPVAAKGNDVYLPAVLETPPHQTWVTVYQADRSSDTVASGDTENREQRLFALGRSVASLIEETANLLADRPSDETADWIQPWLVRYRDILLAANFRFPVDTESAAEPSPVVTDQPPNPSDETVKTIVGGSLASQIRRLSRPSEDSTANDLNWDWLTNRILTQTGQLNVPETNSSQYVFSVNHHDGYRLESVTRLTAGLPPPRIAIRAAGSQQIRRLLVNVLVLIVALALLASAFPYRRKFRSLTALPSFWLGLLGICCLVVAPLPVALAIILVAIALPTVPEFRRKRGSAKGNSVY